MPRLTAPIILCSSLSSTLAVAQPVPATGPKPVIARAVGNLPSEAAVRFVAENARPTIYDARHRPELQVQTLDQAVAAHCGSVQTGYKHALAAMNPHLAVPDGGALGLAAYLINWPACLRAEVRPDGRYLVRKTDTLTSIRQRFTGSGAFVRADLNRFFAASNITVGDAKSLKAGREITVPLKTESTLLLPRGLTSREFAARLSAVAAGDVQAIPDAQSPGQIIGPVQFHDPNAPIGSTQGTFAPCVGGDGTSPYPFDAAEVKSAFTWIAASIPNPPQRVTVVVIDNGFFGAPCDPNACPQMAGNEVAASPHFPRKLFDTTRFDSRGGFGPFLSGSRVQPLNYWNHKSETDYYGPGDVNAETGHGTHVAGLVLGGPTFEQYRTVFEASPDRYWVRLVIANLSNGQRDLLPGTDRDLGDILEEVSGPKVVNMSVAFDASAGNTIGATVKSAIAAQQESLFVVAAGNDGGSLNDDNNDVYPANLGGKDSNVVTVASVDAPLAGKVRLSRFSNRSNEYVDLAAPGCRISSWIDSTQAIEESGTSQATPLVSFAAALLKSLWDPTPQELKNRLLYSTDLLDDATDRDAVRSFGRLDIAKALTFSVDRVTFERNGVRRTLLGKLDAPQNLSCATGDGIAPPNLRAIKRAEDGRAAFYRVRNANQLLVCWGSFSSGPALSFQPIAEVKDGQIVAPDPLTVPIQRDETIEVVMRD